VVWRVVLCPPPQEKKGKEKKTLPERTKIDYVGDGEEKDKKLPGEGIKEGAEKD